MAELTLKDESVIEIGQAVGNNMNSLAGGAGTALVPAGGGGMAPMVEPMPMNPFDSMMTVLSDIRDGVYSLVDKFSESVSIQQEQDRQGDMAQDLAQVGGDETPIDSGGDDTKQKGFFANAKDKVKGLLGAGGIKGLLVKGGLIFGLLAIAKLLQKYGKQIAEAITPVIDGVKEFISYIKDDLATFGSDILGFVKDAFGGIFNLIKGIFSGDGELIKDGLVDLLALPSKFVGMVGKLVTGLLEAFLKVLGFDPAPEWVQKMYDFFDELPLKAKEFFKGVMDFFTVTVPEKITAAKETVTQWFTDAVAGVKQFFTDVKTFFTETIPTKIAEVYTNVTNWFTDIVSGIKGFFTDAFDYVTITIPEKIGEITKGISDKFGEIKDQIIDFAMAPFRKIRELFDNLVIGILESVEDIPLIGGKAKEMKEAILNKRADKAAALEEVEMKNSAFDRLAGDTKKYENQINDFMAMSGYQFDIEKSLMAYEQGFNKLQFTKNGGNTSAAITAATFDDMEEIKYILERGSNIGYEPATTGGATGNDLNNESAEFVGATNGAGGGDQSTYVEGAKVSTVSSQQNYMSEDTGTQDKEFKFEVLGF